MSLFDRMHAPLRITAKMVRVRVATVAAFCVTQLACTAAWATGPISTTPFTPSALSSTAAQPNALNAARARGDAAASGPAAESAEESTAGAATKSNAAGAAAPSGRSSAAITPNDVSIGPSPGQSDLPLSVAPGNASQKATNAQGADTTGTIGQSTNPLTFRSIVPPEWIEAQGAHAYDRAAAFAAQQDQLVPDSNAQAARVHAIFNKLIPFALKWNDRAKDWHWEIALVKSPDIDAISLPGGKFVIDTGMLDRVGLNDDETAILIGHLMAHSLREHARSRIGESLQAIEQAQGIPTGITARGVEGNRVNIAPELLGMRYGADDETEADVIGADITSRAGFDPRAGLAYWQKIDRIGRWRSQPAFTAAHPISDKRLRDLKKRQKDMLELYAKAIGKPVGDLPPYREGKWNPEERGR